MLCLSPLPVCHYPWSVIHYSPLLLPIACHCQLPLPIDCHCHFLPLPMVCHSLFTIVITHYQALPITIAHWLSMKQPGNISPAWNCILLIRIQRFCYIAFLYYFHPLTTQLILCQVLTNTDVILVKYVCLLVQLPRSFSIFKQY